MLWQRAMIKMDMSLLVKDLHSSWQDSFQYLVLFHDGIPITPIKTSMRFLGYACTVPTCRTPGCCETFCYNCKRGGCYSNKSNSEGTYTENKQAREKAYKAYVAGLSAGAKAVSRKDFNDKHFSGASKPERKGALISTSEQAYQWLAKNQSVVITPDLPELFA